MIGFRKGLPVKITEIMQRRTAVSFEVFPPKLDRPIEPLKATLDKLMAFSPDFISCTYGAGGTNKGRQSEILEYIVSCGTHAMSNYTCIGASRDSVQQLAGEYTGFGVETFLALRGDIPAGQTGTNGDFHYGCELIAFLREHFPALEIAGACYPEKHLFCPDMDTEIRVLLKKQEAGADFVVSQLCHDLDNYFRYEELARRAGFTLPIDFGLMPVLAKDSTLRMALSNGCSIPRELAEIIGKYGDSPEDFKKAGKEYTVKQIERLLAHGVDGLHVFALNKYDDVAEIVTAAGLFPRHE